MKSKSMVIALGVLFSLMSILFQVGCTSFVPISDKNPLSIELLHRTIDIHHDKIENITFYVPKRASASGDTSGVMSIRSKSLGGGFLYLYPYLGESKPKIIDPHLVIYYQNESWLFFSDAIFFCEETKASRKFTVNHFQKEEYVRNLILEKVDMSSNRNTYLFLSSCKTLTIRLTGKDGHYSDFEQDQNNRDAFKEILYLWDDLKGKRTFESSLGNVKTP